MWVVIGILFFVAWLASYFFRANVSIVVSYILIALACISFIIHFIVVNRRRSTGGRQG